MAKDIESIIKRRDQAKEIITQQSELVQKAKDAARTANGKEAVVWGKSIFDANQTIAQFSNVVAQLNAEIEPYYRELAATYIREYEEESGYLRDIRGFVEMGILEEATLIRQVDAVNAISQRFLDDPELARWVRILRESESTVVELPIPAETIPSPVEVTPEPTQTLPLFTDVTTVTRGAPTFFMPAADAEQETESVEPLMPSDPAQLFPRYDQPEFGPLSRRDIAVIAAAMSAHGDVLVTLGSDHGLRLLDEDMLRHLIEDICGDQPVLTGKYKSAEEREQAITALRMEALQKIRSFLESDQFPGILDEIDKNGDRAIWALLFNLYEMKILIMTTQSGTRRGIDVIADVLTLPSVRDDIIAERANPPQQRLPRAESAGRDEIITNLRPVVPSNTVPASIMLEEQPPATARVDATPSAPPVSAIEATEEVDESSVTQPSESAQSTAEEASVEEEVVEEEVVEEEIPHKENKKMAAAKIELRVLLQSVLAEKTLGSAKGSTEVAIHGCFPRIKPAFINELMASSLIGSLSYSPNGKKHFSQAQIAAILYFYDHQNDSSLNPRLKKSILKLAEEELAYIQAGDAANKKKPIKRAPRKH